MAETAQTQDGLQERIASTPIYVGIVAGLLFVIGLFLTIGGIWLASLGGSIYYLIAGIGLIVSAWLLVERRSWGVWLYVLVYIGTLIWAFWEVGAQPWPLLPRVFAPTIILLLVLLCLPLVTRWAWGWAIVADVVVAAAFVIAAAIIANAQSRSIAPMPAQYATTVTDPSLLKVGADWPAYGGSYSAWRFSPLTQITPANVGKLKRAWVYHTGDLPKKGDTENKYGAETTPIKVGNSLYLCSATDIIISLDPATGKQKWRFDPKVDPKWIPYTAACRGVAYYEAPQIPAAAPCHARIIEGTLDARLIAVDARNGQPCRDFGNNGQAQFRVGMGPVIPGMVAITGVPAIVDGVVITGAQIQDNQKRNAASGVIEGYDAVTGKRLWAWDLAHPDWSPNPPPGQVFTRGTPNSWTTSTGDEQLGLVYVPLGNSADDYWSTGRTPVEDEYTAALVALDAKTGKERWHFRTMNKDVWDYDLGSQPTLIDFPTGNGTVPALILTSKKGDIYILDRRTGKPLFPVKQQPAPTGGAEPGQRAAWQPTSTYHTLAFPKLQEKDMWGMSPLDQLWCRIKFRQASYKGMFTPPTADRSYIEYPSYNGGSDWGSIAVDPIRGILIANYNNMANYNRLIPREQAIKWGWAPVGWNYKGEKTTHKAVEGGPQWGVPYAIDVDAGWQLGFTKMMCTAPPYGGVRAIDLRTGKTLWDRPIGTARLNGPFGIPTGLPWTIGTPNNGGPLVTASGLVFLAATTDDLIRAMDIRTGKVLWKDVLPAGGQANPMSFEENGKQYVVIMAGGHHFMHTPIGDSLIAYEVGS